jgi:hypothetical protein
VGTDVSNEPGAFFRRRPEHEGSSLCETSVSVYQIIRSHIQEYPDDLVLLTKDETALRSMIGRLKLEEAVEWRLMWKKLR